MDGRPESTQPEKSHVLPDRIRCGVFVLAGRHPGQSETVALDRSVQVVTAAEEVGFDDVWIAEHHFMSYGVCPSALTFAAHALGRTDRIRVGTAVSVLSTAHPVALAEQAALLDHLSGGRFILGVGRGGPWVDLEVFGTGLARYEHGFPESLDLLLRCWADERVGAPHSGVTGASGVPGGDRENGFAFREVAVVPRPVTRPHPPVAVACTSSVTVELAAERGLPMLLGMELTDEQRSDMVAHYAKAAESAGRDPETPEHIAAVVAHVASDGDRARGELRASMPGWLATGLSGYVPVDGRPRPRRDPGAYTDFLCAVHPVGDPGECVARVKASAGATGIRHVIMMVEGAGDPARVIDNVHRLGAEVLPHL